MVKKSPKPNNVVSSKSKAPLALGQIKRNVYIFAALVIIILVIAGYFIFSFVYKSYLEASEPTVEQIETYRYEVDVDKFQDVISTINKRQLY